ncbi:MAG TPA: APC family permease [Aggregatilineales bacterium]|nr:APC family permease [Aggregatilineales bacterium]
MTESSQPSTGMKKTLGLTGVTVNAMALIAPGAFLWMTYQIQAASADTAGNSTASDMWTGIVAALIVAFLTALAFSELARRYPEAGTGGSYYFAEKVFLDKENPAHHRWARLAKFITGWAAHLFYWVYPGVMVAFFATLVQYVVQQIFPSGPIFDLFSSNITLVVIAVLFSAGVGAIAWRGISGSTNVAIAINVIQLVALIGFSIMALAFRIANPLAVQPTEWYHPGVTSVTFPHSFSSMLVQATIAILILVGFESSTSLAGEAKNPRRDIPRGVILSLIIQGLFAYLFEYFAANYALVNSGAHAFGTGLGYGAVAASGSTAAVPEAVGIAAAGLSGAPLGDMIKQIGGAFFTPQVGFILMIITALTVVIAIVGTTLAAMNTGVRISFAMAQDKEMPELLGALHDKYATPHMAILVMVIVSAIIGALGVLGGIVTLSAVTYASNLGTFILYALICLATIIGFTGTKEFNAFKHVVIPVLGLITNLGLAFGIFALNFAAGGTAATEVSIALAIAGGWLLVSVIFFVVNSRQTGRAIIPSPKPATSTN